MSNDTVSPDDHFDRYGDTYTFKPDKFAEDKANGSDTEVEPRPPAFTDEALALRFAERHANDLRYVPPGGSGSYSTAALGLRRHALAFDLARASAGRQRPSATSETRERPWRAPRR